MLRTATLLVTSFFLCAASFAQQTFLDAAVNGTQVVYDLSNTGQQLLYAQQFGIYPSTGTFASVSSVAEVGALGASVTASSIPPVEAGKSIEGKITISTTVQNGDDFTIGAPGRTSQDEGTFNALLSLGGSLANGPGSGTFYAESADISYTAQFNPGISGGGKLYQGQYGISNSSSGPTQHGGISSPIAVTVPFIFGQPIAIALTLNVDASADSVSDSTESGLASAAAQFFNTFKWDGITSVTDSTGANVSNYTVTSVSGFNYELPAPEPVPEPATWFLALSGIAAIAIWPRIVGP